jgi:hypothetical protein
MKTRKIRRGTFLIGGLAGLTLGVPLQVLGIYGLTQRLGWGPMETGFEHILFISLIFAGFPAFLVSGGAARLVAHRIAERPERGFGRSLVRGALAMGVAGIGIVLLCAVPLGALPENPRHWAPMGGVGLAAGAMTGLAVAVLAGMRQRRFESRRPEQPAQP